MIGRFCGLVGLAFVASLGLIESAHAKPRKIANTITPREQPIGNFLREMAAQVAAMAWVEPARATPRSVSIAITAREQPIGEFLRDVAAQIGIPLIASEALRGSVNGSFTGSSREILRRISKAFDIILYFDGATLYAYGVAELRSQVLSLPADQATTLALQVQLLTLTDANNRLRDTGNGSLIINGTPRFIGQINDLVRALPGQAGHRGVGEVKGAGYEVRIFPLKYARADDLVTVSNGRETRVPGVVSLLRAIIGDQPLAQSVPTLSARPVRQSARRLGGRGLAAVDPDYAQTPILGLDAAEVQSTPRIPVDAEPPALVQAPTAIRIQSSPMDNAVIVRDRSENMAANEQLIRGIDVRPQLVEVEATIIDINTEKLRQLGVNFRFGSGGFGALFGNGTVSDGALAPTGTSRRANVQNVVNSSRGLALSTVLGGSRELIARINALEAKGIVRVVSRPQVMTLSNVEAVFDRTRTFYARVSGRANVDLFNVTTGTALRVTPQVFLEGGAWQIRLIINVEDGSLSTELVDGLPIVDRSTVNTQALLVNGQSLLLGGLTVERSENTVNQVPVLGDIPVVGNLFKDRRKSESRTERLFLITPRVVGRDSSGEALARAAGAPEIDRPATTGALWPGENSAISSVTLRAAR